MTNDEIIEYLDVKVPPKMPESENEIVVLKKRVAELEFAFKHIHSMHGTNFGYILSNTVDEYFHKLFPDAYNPHNKSECQE